MPDSINRSINYVFLGQEILDLKMLLEKIKSFKALFLFSNIFCLVHMVQLFSNREFFQNMPLPPYSIPILTLQVILGVVIHLVFNQNVIGYQYLYI